MSKHFSISTIISTSLSMKKLLLVALCTAAFCFSASAEVNFKFKPRTISQGPQRTKLEQSVSNFLSELDNATAENRALDLSGINIQPAAADRLTNLWNEVHFHCANDFYVSPCLYDYQGIQVRNISIEMEPQTANYKGSVDRELVICMTPEGTITRALPVPEDIGNLDEMVSNGTAVTDQRMRHELLKFVEDFRCYYNEKNIQAIEDIFSDDALIISGSVIQRDKRLNMKEMSASPIVKYTSMNKEEYVRRLKGVFQRNAHIDVKFENINIVKNAAKDDLYGVTLHQSWTADNYHDEGWLFLYWDFREDGTPKILVRTWQMDEAAEQDGLFNMYDFNVD